MSSLPLRSFKFFLVGGTVDAWNTFPQLGNINQGGWKTVENLIATRLTHNYKSAVVLLRLKYGTGTYANIPMAIESVAHYYDARDQEVCIVKSEVSNQPGSQQ